MADPKQQQKTSTTEGATTQLTTTLQSPATYGGGMFGNGDLVNSLINTITGTRTEAEGFRGTLQALNTAMTESSGKSEELLSEAVGKGESAAKKVADNTYRTQKMVQNQQDRMGLNPDVANNLLARTLANREVLSQQYEGARAEYDAAAQVDIMSNPVGYILAQMKLPSLGARVNAIDAQLQRNDEHLRTTQQDFATFRANQVANTADDVRLASYELARAEALKGMATVSELHTKNLGALAQSTMFQLDAAFKMGNQQLEGIKSIRYFKDMEEQQKLRTIQMRAESERLSDLLQKKKEDKEAEDEWNKRLALVSRALGMEVPMNMKTLRVLPKEQQNAWIERAGSGTLGMSISDALTFSDKKWSPAGLAATGGTGLLTTADALAKGVQSYATEAQAAHLQETQGRGKQLSSKELFDRAADTYQAAISNSAIGGAGAPPLSDSSWGVRPGQPGKRYNPYIPDFDAFIAVNPAAANSEVGKAVAQLRATSPGTPVDHSAVNIAVASIVQRAGTGQLHPVKAAQEIKGFMEAAATWNLETKKYNLLGLPVPNKYTIRIDTPSGGVLVDALDETAVRRAIAKYGIESNRLNQGMGRVGSPFGIN